MSSLIDRFWFWVEFRHMKTTVGQFAINDYLRTGSIQNLKETFPHTYIKVAKVVLEQEEQRIRQEKIDSFFTPKKKPPC
jgi:hypothetical protein